MHSQPRAFSLFAGGPFFQMLRRAHLAGEGLELVYRRTVSLMLFAWLPLLVLSAQQGHALGSSVAIPFLLDIGAQSRFLLALPLLVFAEYVVHTRMAPLVGQFASRHLVPEEDMGRFQQAKTSALRLRNSWVAEGILLALVLLFDARLIGVQPDVVHGDTWQFSSGPGGAALTPAGMWFIYVSLPVFRFLLWRWYFRLFIWARFLWQVSRLDLRLVATHPDGVGGLGFLNIAVTAFMPLAVAHGVLLGGLIAERIFHQGARLPEFVPEITAVGALVLCLLIAPLLVFSTRLAYVRREGLTEYGALAAGYVRDFDRKWLRGATPANEPLIGSPDIQSLADLATSLEVVKGMNIVMVSRLTVISIVFYTLAPVVPLVLTMMPLQELMTTLLRILF
jgi:hypothetical protein